MADFNKGDFTQQGVDGHVTAKLRLNAKRYVDLDLTTNETESGCTITGSVYDSLNDIVYPIGRAKTITSKTITENGTYNASADDCDGYNPVTVNVPQPTGNIAITENTAEGEPLDVSQYATATVNVPTPAPERHYVIPNGTYTSMVQGGLSGVYMPNNYFFAPEIIFNIDGVEHILKGERSYAPGVGVNILFSEESTNIGFIQVLPSFNGMSGTFIVTSDTEATPHTISAYYVGEKKYWQILSVKNSTVQFVQYETYWGGSNLYSEVINIDNDEYTAPILVYPMLTSIHCCYANGTASSIVCSTNVNLSDGYYSKPSDENNLAFITWNDNVS